MSRSPGSTQRSDDPFWNGCRFRLYRLGDDGKPQGIAEADDAASIGVALVTIAEENRLAGEPAEVIGLLDWHAHRWVTSLWAGRNSQPF